MFHKVKQLFIRDSVILLLAAAFIAAAGSFAFAETDFSGYGSGTEEDPYTISSLNELQQLSSSVKDGNDFSGKYICLIADIDLPASWEPLGALKEGASGTDDGKNINPFSGVFDGGGHTVRSADGGYALFGFVRNATIRNLFIEGNNINGNGLIRNYVVDYGPTGNIAVHTADIRNVTIKSGTKIRGSGFVGGEASSGNTVDITGCVIEEGVTVGYGGADSRDKVGSFGGAFNGTITLSSSAADVYGRNYVGGIIGCQGQSMSQVVISGCTFSGKVTASGSYAGGIAGGGYGGHNGYTIETAPNGRAINIDNCHSCGVIEAKETAGGVLGYETTAQVWDNAGERYIQNNLFAGSVSVSEGSACGGIIGAFRGLSRNNVIRNNFYKSGCGVDRGIGKVTYVDTTCEDHETIVGENYFSSLSEETIPVYEGLNDKYPGNIKVGYYRTDDPLGADADSLARLVTDAELADGSLVAALNSAEWSKGCWKQGPDGPFIDITPIPVSIAVVDGYKDKYYIGEELDKENLHFTVKWNNGDEELIDGNSEDLTISGFDSSKKSILTIIAKYRSSVTTGLEIKIIDQYAGKVLLTFTLLGDSVHGSGEETIMHTKTRGNLQTWFKKNYVMTENDTVFDLIVKALGENGLSYKGNRIYISGVQIPETDEFLMEKANGPASGWMYCVDDKEPSLNVGEFFLYDGARVILFYSDDYTLERSSFSPDEIEDRLKAEDAADLIKVLPAVSSVKLADKEAVERAQNEYKKLTEAQKEYISDYLKKKLSDVLARIKELEKKVIYKGKTYKVNGSTYKVTVKAVTGKRGQVTVVKMKKAEKSVVPVYIKLADGRKYNVTVIGKRAFSSATKKAVVGKNVAKINKYAFAGSRIKAIYIKTKKLKKTSVRGCLRGSKVKTIKVSLGSKKINRKYRTRYKKVFTKKVTGRKVVVR